MPSMRMSACIVALFVFSSAYAPPATAQQQLTTWRATEVWRVDGTQAGEPFANVRDLLIGSDGTLWALDFKDQRIRRFDANGTELASVSRKGSGPGEMRNANGMVMGRDGSVWVNDPSNGRLSQFDANGRFLKQHLAPGGGYGYRWGAWHDRRTGEIVDQFLRVRPDQSSEMEWRRWSADGAIRDTFPIPTCLSGVAAPLAVYRAETKGKGDMGGQYPFTTGGGQTPNGTGGVWCASPSSTTVALVRIGKNDTLLHTALRLPAIPIGKAERQAAINEIQKEVAKYAVNNFDPAKVPSVKSAIAALTVDDDGRLWVQHATQYGDTTITFDVHDAAGKHLGRVRIPQRPALQSLPIRARGNSLWIAIRDADDVISIARYRIAP